MGWRDSYVTLVELFPQVDPRLIKGAALEHGNDVGAAAEFILSDVLGADEGILDNVPDPAHLVPSNSSEDIEQSLAEEQAVIATNTGDLLGGDEHGLLSVSYSEAVPSVEAESGSPILTEAEALELSGESPGNIRDEVLSYSEAVPSKEADPGFPILTESECLELSGEIPGNIRDEVAESRFPILTESECLELSEESPGNIRDEVLTMKEMGLVESEVLSQVTGGSTIVLQDAVPLDLDEEVENLFKHNGLEKLRSTYSKLFEERTADLKVPTEVSQSEVFEDENLLSKVKAFEKFMSTYSKLLEGRTAELKLLTEVVHSEVVEENKSEVQLPAVESDPTLCDPRTSSASLTEEANLPASEDDLGEVVDVDVIIEGSKVELVESLVGDAGPKFKLQGGERLESVCGESTSQERKEFLEEAGSQMQEQNEVFEEAKVEEFNGYHFSLEDEFLVSTEVPRSSPAEEVALDDTVGNSCAENSLSMMSIQKSAISEEMDRADWENVNSSSIMQVNQMQPLDALVEEAKVDKEALISSIEEIRVLRLMTDQAEYAARQSREEAARGGLDVMSRVEEMRRMLSLAREANAVHAGEVFGEKAVLATEARELQYRLVQVNQEKAKAVAALNEIKASLQARIKSAVREREAAEQEKACKELLAKEALAKEEVLVAKVAQESRDLDAEAEACSKIRDFLVERGSIVDALQGEVAVLREDAEALKKDLESMSLSYSGCQSMQIYPANFTGSEMFSSISSRFGKLSDGFGQPSDPSVEVEDGAVLGVGNSGALSLHSVSGVQKSISDIKPWSSIPSLLRAMSGSQLSGSQDLNNSGHSGYSSSGSNLLQSIRDTVMGNEDQKTLGLENVVDVKYPSSPSSAASPGATQAERELLRAKMAMFPGEDLEMEYNGIHNLDVFRTEKSNESRAETDEEDWLVLKASSESSASSLGK